MIRNCDDSMMCNGVKADGDHCQFKAREGMKTCWRHRGQEEGLKGVSKKQPAKEEAAEAEE